MQSVEGQFTPVQSGLGGLVIGTSVAAQLLLTGRVLGVSGTVRGVATGAPGAWRPAFVAGLALTAVPLALMLPATMIALPPSFTVSPVNPFPARDAMPYMPFLGTQTMRSCMPHSKQAATRLP